MSASPVDATSESSQPEAVEPQQKPVPAAWHAWLDAVRAALPVWLTAYAGYLMMTVLGWGVGASRFTPAPDLADTLTTSWLRWDAKHFIYLVDHGYQADWAELTALFPLYPGLVRGLDEILPGSPFVASIAVSATAFLAALALLYRLVTVEFDRDVARRAIWLLVAFPTAFFLGLGYNESLFLCLMLACVYALRRERWWWAGGFGLLATLTRSAGLLLALAFAFEYLRRRDFAPRRIRLDALAVLLVPAGLGLYVLYLRSAVGNPFAFMHAQEVGWNRHLSWPWEGIANLPVFFTDLPSTSGLWLFLAVVDPIVLAFMLALLVLTVVGPWRLRRDQLVFPLLAAVLLLFMLSFPPDPQIRHPLMSVSRLSIEVFPIFMVLARARPLRDPYTYLGLSLQALLLVHFVRGGWVA